MNRGKHKGVVSIILVVLSIIAALLVELVTGSTGSASTPASPTGSATSAPAPGGAAPNSTKPNSAKASSPAGTGNYRTVGAGVNLRAAASVTAPIITVLRDLGSPVTLTCYQSGSSIGGDPWWYRATYGSARGWVAGYWVNTGPDPLKTRLPAC